MKILKFSKDYSKLEDRVFTTIRRYDRYKVGEIVSVKTPTKQFHVLILHKFKSKAKDLHKEFLCYDTDTDNLIEAINVLNSFYKKPINDFEKMTILILEKFRSDYKNGV